MINTKKLLYFAYGTNLNKKIFLKKYKNAKYLSKYILKGFELVNVLFHEKKNSYFEACKILPKSHEKWLSTK